MSHKKKHHKSPKHKKHHHKNKKYSNKTNKHKNSNKLSEGSDFKIIRITSTTEKSMKSPIVIDDNNSVNNFKMIYD